MFEHELFAKYRGKQDWERPILRVQPASTMHSYIVFATPHLLNFRAHSLAVARVENGGVVSGSIPSSLPRAPMANERLDAFIDIYGSDLGEWHVLQGLSLPQLETEKSFYLARIDPSETMSLAIFRPGKPTAFEIPLGEATPYGPLIGIRARHETELYSKISNQVKELRLCHANEVERHLILPAPNAFLHVSDHYNRPDEDYESVAVLVGTFNR